MARSCEEVYPLYDENSKCDIQLLAQSVERQTFNLVVVGSTPIRGVFS